ncbi:hypothetical protein V8E53_010468 [Lactarius tabidus]
MGFQSPPCAQASHEEFRRPQIRPRPETPKAESSSKAVPDTPRECTRSRRAPAKTAYMPLVPRTPWPKGVPAPSGRKGKSVLPSTTEKDISTPSMVKEVEAPRQLQSQILKRTSSCGTSLHTFLDRPTRGTNAPTISAMFRCILRLAKKYIIESAKESFSLLGDYHLHLSCAKDDSVSCIQQNRAGVGKYMSDETVPADQAHLSSGTKFDTISGVPVEQMITCTGSECKTCGGQRAACTLDVRSEDAEQSKRSNQNFKFEEAEDTRNLAEPSNSDYLVPCRCSICARRAP